MIGLIATIMVHIIWNFTFSMIFHCSLCIDVVCAVISQPLLRWRKHIHSALTDDRTLLLTKLQYSGASKQSVLRNHVGVIYFRFPGFARVHYSAIPLIMRLLIRFLANKLKGERFLANSIGFLQQLLILLLGMSFHMVNN